MTYKNKEHKPKISLIIAFYKNFKALELIFLSLKEQKFKNFEVIIAEDDNNPQTFIFINKWKEKLPFEIKHTFQKEKLGFRKNFMLNKAVKISSGEILVFIDGDVILHKHFLQNHYKNTSTNCVSYGRRVRLDKKFTENLYSHKKIKQLTPLNLVFSKSTKIQYGFLSRCIFVSTKKSGIRGSNWSITKDDLKKINGFDEDYTTAGVGEDTDIEWRLRGLGIKIRSIRYCAIQYHLFHEKNYSTEDVNIGFKMMKDKQKNNIFVCKNGLEKL